MAVFERRPVMHSIRDRIPTVARLFLGLVFTTFVLTFSLPSPPTPPPPPRAGAFAGALYASGYLFQLLKATEVLAGVALLAGRFVPLALTVLAPIIVNILGFHLFLAPSGLALPLAVLAAELYLAWTYRSAFAPMLRWRTPLAHSAPRPEAEPLRAAARRPP